MDKTERELREMLTDRRLLRWPTEPQWVAIWKAANTKGYTGNVSTAVQGIAPDLLDADWVGMMNNEPEAAKMMWSEIRLRRSVAPFLKAAAKTGSPFNPDAKHEAAGLLAGALQNQVTLYVNQGWVVVSDGPSGVQLRAPKKMKMIDLVCFIIGLPTIIYYGLGLILIGLGLLDYFVFTKHETKFLPRS